ncbi:hypothetical protein F4779DRAFT_571678 [Xylariaceae sp. FL0662B]|nr:hypothetical protein F4779DRAFT_571678 [Xylariaceae sp. FL0662B]
MMAEGHLSDETAGRLKLSSRHREARGPIEADPKATGDQLSRSRIGHSRPPYYPQENGRPVTHDVEATKKCQAARDPRDHLLSDISDASTSPAVGSPTGVSPLNTPPIPTTKTAAETSKPTVRFSDRVLPPASLKRPLASRRANSNDVPVAEWGVLFDENGYATRRVGQVLQVLARHIVDEFVPRNSLVVTPEKLGLLYSRYPLDPEVYRFSEMFTCRARDAHDRIADFFTDLDCQYHLIQLDSRSRPRVPALTPIGFAQYMTTCILAYPDEEFRRLDKIVQDIPLTLGAAGNQSERLPRELLRSLFPVRPDSKSKKILIAALDDLMDDLELQPLDPKSPYVAPVRSARREASSSYRVSSQNYAPGQSYSTQDTPKTLEIATGGPRFVTSSRQLTDGKAADDYDRDRVRSRHKEPPEIHHGPRSPEAKKPHYDRDYIATGPADRGDKATQARKQATHPSTSDTRALVPFSNSSVHASGPSYRRPPSPRLRTHTASAPDISSTVGPTTSASPSSSKTYFRPLSYISVSTTSPTSERREYVASPTTYSPTTTTARSRDHVVTSKHGGVEKGHGADTRTVPASKGGDASRRSERQHHHHRRSATVEEDRRLTWGEVLSRKDARRSMVDNSGRGSGR